VGQATRNWEEEAAKHNDGAYKRFGRSLTRFILLPSYEYAFSGGMGSLSRSQSSGRCYHACRARLLRRSKLKEWHRSSHSSNKIGNKEVIRDNQSSLIVIFVVDECFSSEPEAKGRAPIEASSKISEFHSHCCCYVTIKTFAN
jgi:hypothetical protein